MPSTIAAASMWQSLSHGANYKSAYCMAVCPAGEDVIGPYLRDRARHIQGVVKPLQEKPEPVYVAYARKRWKNKTVKPVGNALHPRSIEGMLQFLPFVFQPNQSRDLHATYHFEFTGDERRKTTIVIWTPPSACMTVMWALPISESQWTAKLGSAF
jgi:hypothetical protein